MGRPHFLWTYFLTVCFTNRDIFFMLLCCTSFFFLCDVTQDRVVTDHASNVSLTSMPSWSPQWHLLPTVIFATNRGNTLIHGTTDTVAPHGIPTNLLDQCVLHYCPAWPLSYHFWLPVSDCENRWLCILLPKFGSKLT